MNPALQRSVCGLLLGVMLCAAPAAAQSEPAPAERLLKEISNSQQLEGNLRVLCDEIGGRMPGTPGMQRAVTWAVEAFRKAGVDEVHTEEFSVPNSWREGDTRIELLTPVRSAVRGVSSAWVPATPRGGIRAEVIDGGSGGEGRITRMAEKARGKILLIGSRQVETFHDLAVEQRDSTVALREAAEVGAAAVLFMSTRAHGLLYRHINILDGKLDLLPTALIAREDALRISRFLENGQKVEMRLSLPNQTGGPLKAHNVVAEIRGREQPDEMVIVGAHLDSWDLGSGCLDNGCNVAMVIEIARGMVAAGVRPRRTVRFILFSAEEQGLLGSQAYVRAHRDELDSIAAVIVHDMGVGKIVGYSLGGRRDIEPGLVKAMEPVAGRGANAHSYDAFFGTDHFDFLLEGVPTLVAVQDTSEYVPVYHSAADTFDKVSLSSVRDEAGIAAVTVFNIADSPERLGKRLDRNQLEHLLEDTRLDDQMKFLELWEDWERGLRGRAK
ncbi:MAG: M20/M25/M40 family metallo-hydrolase [Bryobacterales bacterium]